MRYVDDLYLFGDRRADLRCARDAVASYLEERRHLHLKSPRARIRSCTGTLDGLGVRIRRDGIEPRPRAYARLRAQVARELYRLPGERRPDPARFVASMVGGVLHPA